MSAILVGDSWAKGASNAEPFRLIDVSGRQRTVADNKGRSLAALILLAKGSADLSDLRLVIPHAAAADQLQQSTEVAVAAGSELQTLESNCLDKFAEGKPLVPAFKLSREQGKLLLAEDPEVSQAMFSLQSNVAVYKELESLIDRFPGIARQDVKGVLAHIAYMNSNQWNTDDPVYKEMGCWKFASAAEIDGKLVEALAEKYRHLDASFKGNETHSCMLAEDRSKVEEVERLTNKKRKAESAQE